MRPIPQKLRKSLSDDPFMRLCIHEHCYNTPEWEHCYIYAGKQINEAWAIVPCCTYHHRGAGLDKQFNKWVSINLASEEALEKYPKKDWNGERKKLNEEFPQDFQEYLIKHTHKCLTS